MQGSIIMVEKQFNPHSDSSMHHLRHGKSAILSSKTGICPDLFVYCNTDQLLLPFSNLHIEIAARLLKI